MFLSKLHSVKMFEASMCMLFSSFQPESSIIRFAEFAVIAIASKTYQRPLIWISMMQTECILSDHPIIPVLSISCFVRFYSLPGHDLRPW